MQCLATLKDICQVENDFSVVAKSRESHDWVFFSHLVQKGA